MDTFRSERTDRLAAVAVISNECDRGREIKFSAQPFAAVPTELETLQTNKQIEDDADYRYAKEMIKNK